MASGAALDPQTILMGIQLAAKLVALLEGSKTAAEVDAELKAGFVSNNDWLEQHGFPPVHLEPGP